MRKLIIFSLTMSIVVLLTSGCYTILMHPNSEHNYSSEDYQADCVGCHADYHEYPYGYFYSDSPDYWWSTPRWGKYYAYPWWWDNYWYDNNYQQPQVYNDDPSPRSSRGKKVERRNTLRPPYTIGTPSQSRPTTGVSIGTTAPASRTSDKNSQPKVTQGKTKTKEEKKPEAKKKENKKATRRGGGR